MPPDKNDEAQVGQPLPPAHPTNGATPVESFRMELYIGASIEVNGKDWMKAGATGSQTWKSIPSPKELNMAKRYIEGTVLGPAVDGLITEIRQKLVEKQKNT